MKRRNRESRARMRIIQEMHMNKHAQRKLDQTMRLAGSSYVKVLSIFRATLRIKDSILAFKTQIGKALIPPIRILTSMEDTYTRGDLNGYTAEEMKEAGEAAAKGFLAGLSLAKRLNKLEE